MRPAHNALPRWVLICPGLTGTQDERAPSPRLPHASFRWKVHSRLQPRQGHGQGGPGTWESSEEDGQDSDGTGGHSDGQARRASHPANLSVSVFKGGGTAGREGGDRKTKQPVDGSHLTSDRVNIYPPIHGPGPGERPLPGPPESALVSGPDLRPEPAEV